MRCEQARGAWWVQHGAGGLLHLGLAQRERSVGEARPRKAKGLHEVDRFLEPVLTRPSFRVFSVGKDKYLNASRDKSEVHPKTDG